MKLDDDDELGSHRAEQYPFIVSAIIKKEGVKNFERRCIQKGGHPVVAKMFWKFFPESEMKFSPK
ncbi:MAG: hypothetical protein U9O66_03635 [Patescibacteria group bacterium]|nr:hypothetical protein [Patescibacteria group bacterium]